MAPVRLILDHVYAQIIRSTKFVVVGNMILK